MTEVRGSVALSQTAKLILYHTIWLAVWSLIMIWYGLVSQRCQNKPIADRDDRLKSLFNRLVFA